MAPSELCLIKDSYRGEFDTSEIERHWNVSVFPSEGRQYKMDFGKLEPLFLPGRKRFLVLDSDIAFVGPVLDALERCSEDFVFQYQGYPGEEEILRHYYDKSGLKEVDPGFEVPDRVFNFGQFVGTSGIFKKSDFTDYVVWENPPRLKHPQVFKLGLQGFMNYFIEKKTKAGLASVATLPFMLSPDNPEFMDVQLEDIEKRKGREKLMHWCGFHSPNLGSLPNAEILLWFEKLYYSKVGCGKLKRFVHSARAYVVYKVRSVLGNHPEVWRFISRLRGLKE